MEGRFFCGSSTTKTSCSKSLRNRSNFNSFIKCVNSMLKKVEIDDNLSCLLDEFLEKLKNYNVFLSNGIFNTNFTEAALFLQSSAELYGKKVDLLWDIIIDYQKRMILYDKQNKDNEEIEKLEERKRKYKRKRKIDTNQTITQQSEILSNFTFNSNNFEDYINHNYEQNDLLSTWNNYVDASVIDDDSNNCTNRTARFLPEDRLRNLDDNEYIGRYEQFHIASLIPELFDINDNTTIKIDNQSSFFDSGVVLDETCSSCSDNFETSTQCVSEEKLCSNSCYIQLQQLPNDLVEEKLRKSISLDSGFNQTIDLRFFVKSFVQLERLPQSIIDEKLKKIKRSKSMSQDSAFYDDFDSSSGSSHQSLCCGGSTVVISNNKNCTKLSNNIGDSDGERPSKRRRISMKLLKRYSTGCTVSSASFEKFYHDQYKSADGEGIAERPEFSTTEDNHDFDDNEYTEEFQEDTQSVVSNRLELSQIDDGFNSTPTLTLSNNDNDDDDLISDASQTAIREWKSFILPKLKNLEKRSEFDIHEYGTKIIEPSYVGETKAFKDIIADKRRGECARYFLTTLQLANTNNIKFSGILSGQLSDDTLKITIVDKTRYHEFLDDYQAPSEEVFRSKFERIQAMNPDVLLQSTPYGGPSMYNKPNLVRSPKKIKFS